MLAYLFPGQGSQSVGMGKALFAEFPELTQKANAILGYSIAELCVHDPLQQLNQTQYTQPAVFVVNALSYYHQLRLDKRKPDVVCGHSLGEYNALLAAEVFDFEVGLRLVQKRGELMRLASRGSMAAVLGLSLPQLKDILRNGNIHDVEIANQNTYTQYVLAGAELAIQKALTLLQAVKQVTVIPLKVSGAFHSKLMQNASEQFREFLNDYQFVPPSMPVIANLNAKPYHPAMTADNLVQQIYHPVLWVDCMEYLFGYGDLKCEEIGVGRVLSGLVQRIRDKS